MDRRNRQSNTPSTREDIKVPQVKETKVPEGGEVKDSRLPHDVVVDGQQAIADPIQQTPEEIQAYKTARAAKFETK